MSHWTRLNTSLIKPKHGDAKKKEVRASLKGDGNKPATAEDESD